MAQVIPLGPGTVYDGFGLQTPALGGAVMAPSLAPTTTVGPASQPTLPSMVGGTSSPTAVADPYAMAQGGNVMSSHSPALWAAAGLLISVIGLHWIFYPKEKVV